MQSISISVFCGIPSCSTVKRVKNKLMWRELKRSKRCSMRTDRKFFPWWCEFGRFQQQHKCQVLGVFPRGLGTHHIPYKCRLLSETRFSCCFLQHVHILDWALTCQKDGNMKQQPFHRSAGKSAFEALTAVLTVITKHAVSVTFWTTCWIISAVVGTVTIKWWKQWKTQYPTEIGVECH